MRIDEVIVKNLPSKPGIYIFKNKNSETLYVGKAKNLQKRISSYFSKSRDSRLNIEFLMREAWDIDFTSTNSEEEALMLESKTIPNLDKAISSCGCKLHLSFVLLL